MDVSRWKRRENTWFAIVVLALVAAVAATIFETPWNASAKADQQVVEVVAQQYGFTFSTDTVQANRQVEFRLSAKDVNHAFAIFDPSGAMVAQAQMMPDWPSTLRVTLKQPGVYAVRCFEYCGVGHHQMITSFKVVQ
jgi:cytochrome c oxidase subunit 2